MIHHVCSIAIGFSVIVINVQGRKRRRGCRVKETSEFPVGVAEVGAVDRPGRAAA